MNDASPNVTMIGKINNYSLDNDNIDMKEIKEYIQFNEDLKKYATIKSINEFRIKAEKFCKKCIYELMSNEEKKFKTIHLNTIFCDPLSKISILDASPFEVYVAFYYIKGKLDVIYVVKYDLFSDRLTFRSFQITDVIKDLYLHEAKKKWNLFNLFN